MPAICLASVCFPLRTGNMWHAPKKNYFRMSQMQPVAKGTQERWQPRWCWNFLNESHLMVSCKGLRRHHLFIVFPFDRHIDRANRKRLFPNWLVLLFYSLNWWNFRCFKLWEFFCPLSRSFAPWVSLDFWSFMSRDIRRKWKRHRNNIKSFVKLKMHENYELTILPGHNWMGLTRDALPCVAMRLRRRQSFAATKSGGFGYRKVAKPPANNLPVGWPIIFHSQGNYRLFGRNVVNSLGNGDGFVEWNTMKCWTKHAGWRKLSNGWRTFPIFRPSELAVEGCGRFTGWRKQRILLFV